MTKDEMRDGLRMGRRLVQEEWSEAAEIRFVDELVADTEAQAVMDWLDDVARKAGMPIEMAQVLPYDPPAEPDPTLTEVAIPDRPAPGPDGYTDGGDHG